MKSLTRNEKCTTAVVAVLTAGMCASLLGPTPATAASPSEADLWGASFSWEKIRALGGAAAALGAELIGVTAVRQKCFS